MRVFLEPLVFEWDKGNKDKNYVKHGVTNKEIEEVFVNKPLRAVKDKEHSIKEERFQALGKTNEGKRLLLSFTIRKERIRVISARAMNKRERRTYETYEKIQTHANV